MVFHWSLSDSKSPQVSRTLLSILAVFNNAVVWMVSTRPPSSESSSLFSNPLATVPNVPITVGITVTFMFHIFLNSLASRSTYPSFYILSVLFCGQPGEQSRQFCKFSSFCWLFLGLVFWPKLGDPFCMSKSHRSLCVFPPAFAKSLLLDSQRQHVSSFVQNSSHYSGWSQLWMVSILPLISNSSSCSFSKTLEIIPSALTYQPSPSCSTAFFVPWQGPIFVFTFFYFHSMVHWKGSIIIILLIWKFFTQR